MKKKLSLLTLFLLGICIVNEVKAQTINVISVSPKQDRYSFYSQMKEAFPITLQDPASPRFIFFNQKKNFLFGMGGYIQITGVYDFNGVENYTYFTTSTINMKGKQGGASFNINPNQSTIFFKLIGNTDVGRLVAYMNMQFVGPNQTPQLQQAFIQFKGFTIGQAWSTFGDLSATPNTVDLEGPSSAILVRQPMVRYTYNFTKHFQASLAAEYAQPSYTLDNSTAKIRQKAPDVPLAVRYMFKDGSHLQASGVMRYLNYKDLITERDRFVTCWGVSLSGNINITKNITFMFQGLYGSGISNYAQDISGINYDLMPREQAGKLGAPTNWGGYGAFCFQWNPRLQSNFIYSYNRMENIGTMPLNTYKYAQYATANILWNFSEYGQAGLEYNYGRKNEFNNDYGNASRINTMVRYNF